MRALGPNGTHPGTVNHSSLVEIGSDGRITTAEPGSITRKEFSMRFGSICRLVLCATLATLWTSTALAQQVRFFPDFNPLTSPVSSLQTNGGLVTSNGSQYVLRLTQGWSGTGPVFP